jgi:hypothetical protein
VIRGKFFNGKNVLTRKNARNFHSPAPSDFSEKVHIQHPWRDFHFRGKEQVDQDFQLGPFNGFSFQSQHERVPFGVRFEVADEAPHSLDRCVDLDRRDD